MVVDLMLALACGAAAWLVATLARHYLRGTSMTRKVRAIPGRPMGDYVEERREWLLDHRAGRWLVQAALDNARKNSTPEAIAFYQQLASEWNAKHPQAVVMLHDWQNS